MSLLPPGNSSSLILETLAPLQGRRVLDVGCGSGGLLALLAQAGARVAGVDPDEEALARARAAVPRAFLQRAGGEKLPFGDATLHAVVFSNSLHHVPVPQMAPALAEAARVVGPGGSVLVAEPLPEGTFFEAMRPVEDETAIRLAAQEVLGKIVATGVLLETRRVEFERVDIFSGVSAFIERITAAYPARVGKAEEERERITERFHTLAEREARGYVLRQPHSFRHLRVPGQASHGPEPG